MSPRVTIEVDDLDEAVLIADKVADQFGLIVEVTP